MARRTLKICAGSEHTSKIIELVESILSEPQDAALRVHSRDLSRDGILSQELLVTLLLFMVGDANRRGYHHLVQQFWSQCHRQGIPLPTADPVSASAFCQARVKISIELLLRILSQVSERFEKAFARSTRWHGLRVLAVDGSKFNLQRSDELQQAFGRPSGGHCPQATVSTLFNVTSRVPLDVRIAPFASCERKLLIEHLEQVREGDVLVLDRGYPSFALLSELLKRRIQFLIRVPDSHTFESFDWFRQHQKQDFRLVLHPPAGSARDAAPIELRAVRLKNSKGEASYFVTTLMRTEFSRSHIAELYHLRWQIEELYKLEKSAYFDARQFHARTAHGVKQAIVAQALFVAIARFLMAAAAHQSGVSDLDLSMKAGILSLAEFLTLLFVAETSAASTSIPHLLRILARARNRRRPRRSCPRRSFKPGPRWAPDGRRGAYWHWLKGLVFDSLD